MMLKEGAIVDPANRERLAKLLRFGSSLSDDPEARVSLDEYVARMPEDQKRIYYLGGPDLASIKKSPNLEIFRRRGLEVLFLTEPIDEFVMNALRLVRRQAAHVDRLGRPRPARDLGGQGRDQDSRGERRREPRAASPASSTCSARRSASGSRKSASRSG